METDLNHLEEKLRRTEDLLNSTQSLSKIGGWEWDIQNKTIYWTDEVYRIHDIEPYGLGPIPSEYIAKSLQCYRPEDQPVIMDAFNACVDHGTPYDLEFPFTTIKGRKLWIRTSAHRVFKEGEVFRVYGTLMDITERKTAEEVLRREEEKYKAILQTAIDGFWLTDLKGRLLEVNDAYCHMSGYSKEELLSMTIAELEGDMAPQDVAAKIGDVINQGHDRFETHHRRKDGILYDVEVGVQHLPVEKGFLVIFLRDITAHKRAEKEKDLLQTQLVQAQKMESIGRLAGGVAHDFNNMLNVILGFAEIALEHTDLDPEVKTALEQIMNAGERSAEVTRQMLAFARKQTIAPKTLDLNKTVSDMITMIKRLIGEDIDLAWMPEKDLWSVKMDPAQINQILVNLCVNARDAIPDVGKITIETGNVSFDEAYCRYHPSFFPGDFVMLSVSDNGSGMDNETMLNLFEPFFTTKGTDKGTGLGLATVYGIIKQNKGFINVYSEPNGGTCFKIYLPQFKGTESPAQKHIHVAPDAMGRETILLVEDEQAILIMTQKMLQTLGYSVITAPTPKQALTLAREYEGPVHLLMTDVVMPEMNGRDLSHQMLSMYPDLKHLFMSGYTANVIAHHGVLDEGVNFIQKPFSKMVLASKLREVLDGDNTAP